MPTIPASSRRHGSHPRRFPREKKIRVVYRALYTYMEDRRNLMEDSTGTTSTSPSTPDLPYIIFSSSCATYPDLTFSSHLWSEHFLFDFSGIYLMSGLLAGRHMTWFSLEIARYVCMYAGRYARINISVINSTIPFGRCGQEGVPRSILPGRDTITWVKFGRERLEMYVCMHACMCVYNRW